MYLEEDVRSDKKTASDTPAPRTRPNRQQRRLEQAALTRKDKQIFKYYKRMVKLGFIDRPID